MAFRAQKVFGTIAKGPLVMIGSKVYPYPSYKTTWIPRVFLLVKNIWGAGMAQW